MTVITYLCIVVFLLGLYFYAKYGNGDDNIEGMTTSTNTNTNTKPNCPDLLIQKGSRFYLYNSKLIKVPGVNPVEFENLEDYVEFLNWQKSQNIVCPVLYLQEIYDTQGKRVYKTRPSVIELQGGLPSSPSDSIVPSNPDVYGPTPTPEQVPLGPDGANGPEYPNRTLLVDAGDSNSPYNVNSYAAADDSSYYIGTTTPLDAMNMTQEKKQISPDAMDANWGGKKYTQKLINNGNYKNNDLSVAVE